MLGIIYLIINKQALREQKPPYFYIGSKKDKGKFNDYWGSCDLLTEHVRSLGVENFSKIVLEEVELDDLLDTERRYQEDRDCVRSPLFYNRVLAASSFDFSGTGTVWVSDGATDRRVPTDQVGAYEELGFARGRARGTHNRKRVYMNNGTKCRAVPGDMVAEMEADGWSVGRLAGNNRGKVYVTKNGKNLMVHPDQLREFEEDGWTRGCSMVKH
jgi:hypothetical protein